MFSRKRALLLLLTIASAGCGSSGSTGGGADAALVGTWGLTKTTTTNGSTMTDERYLVFGADKSVRTIDRITVTSGPISNVQAVCGAGSYVYANSVLSTTVEETAPQIAATGPKTTTRTTTSSMKVELIDDALRLTTEAGASSDAVVFKRATLPDDIEKDCPKPSR